MKAHITCMRPLLGFEDVVNIVKKYGGKVLTTTEQVKRDQEVERLAKLQKVLKELRDTCQGVPEYLRLRGPRLWERQALNLRAKALAGIR